MYWLRTHKTCRSFLRPLPCSFHLCALAGHVWNTNLYLPEQILGLVLQALGSISLPESASFSEFGRPRQVWCASQLFALEDPPLSSGDGVLVALCPGKFPAERAFAWSKALLDRFQPQEVLVEASVPVSPRYSSFSVIDLRCGCFFSQKTGRQCSIGVWRSTTNPYYYNCDFSWERW